MLIKIKGKGGVRIYSKGYKEGYAKEYQKDVPPFEPKTQVNCRSQASIKK